MNENEELLSTICKASGPSGHEDECAALVHSYFSKYCDSATIHHSNSVIGEIKPLSSIDKKDLFTVMFCAHLDQIALCITKIDDDGFCFITGVGYDPKVLAGKAVTIIGREKVFGIISARSSSTTSHKCSKRGYTMEELCIDTGLSANKVRELVCVGDFAHISDEPLLLLNNSFSSPFLDDRSCVSALILAMKNLQKQRSNLHLFFVASSGEEFSGQGATTSAYEIDPDFAIALDVTFADQPNNDPLHSQKIGEGLTISVGPLYDRRYLKQIVKIATDNKIKFRYEVDKSGFGTDAASIRGVRNGIPVALISLPIENMHTPVELLNLDDFNELVRFITLLSTHLKKEDEYA